MQLRRASMEDLYEMQQCNLLCLPENYNLRYYYYHILSWPQLLYVQQDYNRDTVGYVLAKIDDEDNKDKKHGHITSLAVLRSHRKLGIASKLMRASLKEMDEEYAIPFCSLHVRETNEAALHLYQDTLHFRCAGIEKSYYNGNEDAYHMKYFFRETNPGTYIDDQKRIIRKPVPALEPKASAAGSHLCTKSTFDENNDVSITTQRNSKNLSAEKKRMEMTKLLEDLDGIDIKVSKKSGEDGKCSKNSNKHSSNQDTSASGNKNKR